MYFHLRRRKKIEAIWDPEELRQAKYMDRPYLALAYLFDNLFITFPILGNLANTTIIELGTRWREQVYVFIIVIVFQVLILLLEAHTLWRMKRTEYWYNMLLFGLSLRYLLLLLVICGIGILLGLNYYLIINFLLENIICLLITYLVILLASSVGPEWTASYLRFYGYLTIYTLYKVILDGFQFSFDVFSYLWVFYWISLVWDTPIIIQIRKYDSAIALRYISLAFIKRDEVDISELEGISGAIVTDSRAGIVRNIMSAVSRIFIVKTYQGVDNTGADVTWYDPIIKLPDNYTEWINEVDAVVQKLYETQQTFSLSDLEKITDLNKYQILVALGRSQSELTKRVFEQIKRDNLSGQI